jgi:hypothetical protein
VDWFTRDIRFVIKLMFTSVIASFFFRFIWQRSSKFKIADVWNIAAYSAK